MLLYDSTTSSVLLSMTTMSTSIMKKYEHDIKISMNTHKYKKLWVWLQYTHSFEYSLLTFDQHYCEWQNYAQWRYVTSVSVVGFEDQVFNCKKIFATCRILMGSE